MRHVIPFTYCIVAVCLIHGPLVIAQPRQDEKGKAVAKDVPERMAQGEAPSRGEMENLQERLDALEEQLLDQAGRQGNAEAQRPNIFNPNITVFGNILGRMDSKEVLTEDGEALDDRINLREVEVDFRSAVDPWADGVVLVTLESEVPNEFSAGVEEGYLVLKKLPGLDRAPWGLKLKTGRFRPDFGRFNKIHTHDLPQMTRPLSMQTFLGEEGFVQNGVSGEFSIPTPGDEHSLDVTLALLNGGDLPVAADNHGEDPAFLNHLKWFQDLAPGHDIEIGTSGYIGKFDEDGVRDVLLIGVDFSYRWKPFLQGEWRSFLLGGEFFLADIEGDDKVQDVNPFAYYLWSQYQFNRRLYLGVRFDYTQDLEDSAVETTAMGAYLSYYTTEFLRLRLGYEYTNSDIEARDDLHTVLLEVNFVFGSHPVEPYWVSR